MLGPQIFSLPLPDSDVAFWRRTWGRGAMSAKVPCGNIPNCAVPLHPLCEVVSTGSGEVSRICPRRPLPPLLWRTASGHCSLFLNQLSCPAPCNWVAGPFTQAPPSGNVLFWALCEMPVYWDRSLIQVSGVWAFPWRQRVYYMTLFSGYTWISLLSIMLWRYIYFVASISTLYFFIVEQHSPSNG